MQSFLVISDVNFFIHSHKGGLIIRSMVKLTWSECINKSELINLLVDRYQCLSVKVWFLLFWLQSSWKLFEIYMWDGSKQEIRFWAVWKFCWDLRNVTSGGNFLFRWDCVFSGGTLHPFANYVLMPKTPRPRWDFMILMNFHHMILEKMRSWLRKLKLGFWNYGLICLLGRSGPTVVSRPQTPRSRNFLIFHDFFGFILWLLGKWGPVCTNWT